MSNRKNQNSTLLLAALGMFFGLVLGTSATPALAQKAPQSEAFRVETPLKAWIRSVEQRVASRDIDLDAQFLLKVEAVIGRDGKLDPATVKYTRSEGDLKMIEAAKAGIESFIAGGYFRDLNAPFPTKTVILLKQDGSELLADASFEVENEQRAKTLTSGMGMMLQVAREQKAAENSSGKSSSDLALLNAVKATNDSRRMIISFRMSRDQAQKLIQDDLQKVTPCEQS